MKRVHLFEFGDQKWVPKLFRKFLHELLQYQVGRFYRPLLPTLVNWLQLNQLEKVTDLASGAGGPWLCFVPEIQKIIPAFQLELSDKVPLKVADFKYLHDETDISKPSHLPKGALTIFTAFHHLKPLEAQSFLTTLSVTKQPFLVAEFVERKPARILGMLFSPLVVFIDTLKMRPISLLRILFTFLIPVVPLMYLWDGAISHARAYSISDFNQMTKGISSSSYSFGSVQVKNEDHGMQVTCFYSISGLNAAEEYQ